MNRRKLVTGLISFVAAPAIVRVENLMPIKVPPPAGWFSIDPKFLAPPNIEWRVLDPEMYQDLVLLADVLNHQVQPILFYRQVGRYQ